MKVKKPLFSVIGMVMLAAAITIPAFAGSIKYTRHNLSAGSPAANIKSGDTAMICIFCHTGHSGTSQAPLWNREESKVLYTLYDSSTLYSMPDQPDGASKLCLSCHDGTIALGKVKSKKGEFRMLETHGGRIPHTRKSNLGSDLSDDHPISFDPSPAVSASDELIHPVPIDTVRYDSSGKIQCTTCHDAHDDRFKKFLVKSDQYGAICKSCHQLTGYSGVSTHDISTKMWKGMYENPWTHNHFSRAADNSCMNCHRSHGAEGKERLLNGVEENVCLVCHNGSVGKNIKRLLKKTSGHKVELYQGVHDPTEDMRTAAIHVECADCHNPHRLNNSTAVAPNVSGRLAGVSGMSITGSMKETAHYEYEICLKCHGQDRYRGTNSIKRMFDTANIRLAINPSAASYHAIASPAKSTWVPSLIPPYNTSSRLYCTDCHNSDAADRTNGNAANGPHGSRYEYILERQYLTTDYTHWTEANYALCYKCHNAIILFDDNLSGFEKHETHVRGADTPCSVCHDPHGSPNNVGLINFDTNVVFPNLNGELKFEVIGNTGYCYMQCHGQNHGPKEYIRK